MKAVIVARRKWWVKPYLVWVAFRAACTGKEPDFHRVAEVMSRVGFRYRIEPDVGLTCSLPPREGLSHTHRISMYKTHLK